MKAAMGMITRGSVFFWASGLIASLLVLAWPATSAAQDQGDPVAGQAIAKTWCINCHVVAPGQSQGTSNGAPPFTAIASQRAMTPTALSVFLQTPHHRMPDLQLSRNQIDDVSAYIFSLRTSTNK